MSIEYYQLIQILLTTSPGMLMANSHLVAGPFSQKQRNTEAGSMQFLIGKVKIIEKAGRIEEI